MQKFKKYVGSVVRIRTCLCSFTLLVAAILSLQSPAFEIVFNPSLVIKDKTYVKIETSEWYIDALFNIFEALADSDQDTAQLVFKAILNGEHAETPSMIYFKPPYEFQGRVYYQLYLYNKTPEFLSFIKSLGAAIRQSEQAERYASQLERMDRQLANALITPSPPNTARKTKLRSGRVPIDLERKLLATNGIALTEQETVRTKKKSARPLDEKEPQEQSETKRLVIRFKNPRPQPQLELEPPPWEIEPPLPVEEWDLSLFTGLEDSLFPF